MALNLTTKNEIRVILTEAGLWRAFHIQRDIYKAQITGEYPDGMPAKVSYQKCFEEFFPDGLASPPILPNSCSQVKTESGAVGTELKSRKPTDEPKGTMKPSAIGLLPDGVMDGKTCSRAEIVDWVAKNIAIRQPSWEDCPSSEAWAMLTWVRQPGGINEGDFWKSIYRALLPTKSELDATARFTDDGRNVLRVITQMEKVAQTQEE